MSEAALWRVFRQHIGPYGHVVRHENRVEAGTPDVSYTIQGVSGWIELKQLDEPPKRPTTSISITHLTKEQILWAQKERKAGGRMWMLLKVGQSFALCDPDLMERIYRREVLMEDLRFLSRVLGHGRFPVEDVVRCLVQ